MSSSLPTLPTSRVSAKQWVGHRVREVGVHVGRLAQPKRAKSIVFFPYTGRWVCGSVNLRVHELCTELRALGWRTTIAPAQLELVQRQRILDAEKPSVVVLQKGRHPLNWPHFHLTNAVKVFDIDDADYANPKAIEQCKACCEGCDLVFAGSENVAAWCRQFAKEVHTVWTPHPIAPARPTPPPRDRAPLLAWAQSGSMAYRNEARIVQGIVLATHDRFADFSFEVFGADDPAKAEEFIAPLRAAGVGCRAHPYMKYPAFLRELSRAAVGLHVISPDSAFSQGKSFGKVLAYLAADVAVVSSNVHENPRFFRSGISGELCDHTEQFADACAALLRDPTKRQAMADAAHADFAAKLSTRAVAAQVDTILTTHRRV